MEGCCRHDEGRNKAVNDINHQDPASNAARKLDRRPLWRLLVFWALCIATFLMIWQFLTPEAPPSVAFSDFMALVRADAEREPHVQEVSVRAARSPSGCATRESRG